MCIIVDANAASEIVPPSKDALPIVERLTKGDLRIVSGHRLKKELQKTGVRYIYRELVGRFHGSNHMPTKIGSLRCSCGMPG
jgi:hypothetical protein